MKVAITGGIGAGKSFVCRCLEARGIMVYDCDSAAKRLMRTSAVLRGRLRKLVGGSVFEGEKLRKAVLAKYILESGENAQAVDDVVHPAVAGDFLASGLDWIESAIFFDSGFYRLVRVDRVICVTAPPEVRIARVMERDSVSREKALGWICRQLPQEEVLRRSDYEIINDGIMDIDKQLDIILKEINK